MALICLSLYLLICVGIAMAQHSQIIEYEHRFTSLETQVQAIQSTLFMMASDIKEVKTSFWIAVAGLAGLVGEAGLRVFKKKEG